MVKKLVYGVGVNDADYKVKPVFNGARIECKFYDTWVGMLERCYSEKYQARQPTYIGCTVCDDWLTFSSFKAWMETQDWKGKELDKDLLVTGNKVYSPHFCCFIPKSLNKFISRPRNADQKLPLGVYFNKHSNKYMAQCCNQITKKNENLGYFNCPYQAHKAWKKRKHELACQLAELQTDQRVANALRIRYL